MKLLKRVGTEMALHVLAYNLKRVINIIGIAPLIAAMRACNARICSAKEMTILQANAGMSGDRPSTS